VPNASNGRRVRGVGATWRRALVPGRRGCGSLWESRHKPGRLPQGTGGGTRLDDETIDSDPESTKRTPWTKDGFRSSWRKAVLGTAANPSPLKPIADAGLVFHGLRKSAVCMLLEAGCTEAETQAINGQSSKMVQPYARQVNRTKLAASAILKLERSGNGRL